MISLAPLSCRAPDEPSRPDATSRTARPELAIECGAPQPARRRAIFLFPSLRLGCLSRLRRLRWLRGPRWLLGLGRLRLRWLLGRSSGSNRRPHLEKTGQHGAVWRAKSAAGVPSRSRIIAHILVVLKTDAIVSHGDVVKRPRVGRQRVKLGIHESDAPSQLLVDDRDQRRP